MWKDVERNFKGWPLNVEILHGVCFSSAKLRERKQEDFFYSHTAL